EQQAARRDARERQAPGEDKRTHRRALHPPPHAVMQLFAMQVRTVMARVPPFATNAPLHAASAERELSARRASRRHWLSVTIARLQRTSCAHSVDGPQHAVAWHCAHGSGPGSGQMGPSTTSAAESRSASSLPVPPEEEPFCCRLAVSRASEQLAATGK